MATVAVVIPCRNEAGTIGRLLDALRRQTRLPDQIVVVDDRSTDATADVIAEWRAAHASPSCVVLNGAGRGVAAAVNAGVAVTQADIIVRIDGHSVPADDYIERALAALEQPEAGVVGGVWTIEPGANTNTAIAIARVVSHPLGSGGAKYRHATSAPAGVEAADTVPFGVFRRSLWAQVGGFDEQLGANEDYDFNYRVRQTGARVLLDGRVRSTYSARPTLRALARQYHRYGFWKARMLMKDVRAVRPRQLAAAAILPWFATSLAVAVFRPGTPSVVLAAAYPLAIVSAAATIGAQARSVGVAGSAILALVTVHVSWSAGFLRAILRLGSPDGPRR